MQIILIPLDERPVNIRYPQMIGAAGGVRVTVPPPALLSQFRKAAPSDALTAWLLEHAPHADALIVSVEMLGYGGLIPSRISHEPPSLILERLALLRTLRKRHPQLKIYGFNVITRISRHDDATEEPAYWGRYGNKLFRLSQLMDKESQWQDVADELEALRAEIPQSYAADFLSRRRRNHTVNRRALQMLAEGVFDLLVLSSDDTSEYGLSSNEKRILARYAEELALDETRLLMYPGADEVGSVLVARLLNQAAGVAPRILARYMVDGGDAITAPFEDSAVSITVERQIVAAGAQLVTDAPDLTLLVNPPISAHEEWVRPYTAAESALREPQLRAALDAAPSGALLADVAFPNGADPALMAQLGARLCDLRAYGGWNTAGNTLGTVIAAGCASVHAGTDAQQRELRRFLAHHVIEAWAYMSITRPAVRAWLGATAPDPAQLDETAAWIEAHLRETLPSVCGWRIVAGSLRLPWKRTFEIDFDLEPAE